MQALLLKRSLPTNRPLKSTKTLSFIASSGVGESERALLIFGPVGDERSTFVVEDREQDLVCRPLSEPRVLMQFRDDLATKNPQVIAMPSQGFARRA